MTDAARLLAIKDEIKELTETTNIWALQHALWTIP